MQAHGIRLAVRRVVVIAVLAATVFVGAIAVGPRSEAAAATDCGVYATLASWADSMATAFYRLGDLENGGYWLGRGAAYLEAYEICAATR
jgi:hypothetical protein